MLSFLREDAEQHVLVVANLGATAQYVQLDLSRFAGWQPVEMIGNTQFPPIGELTYFLTLAERGFYWFDLKPPAAAVPQPAPSSATDETSTP